MSPTVMPTGLAREDLCRFLSACYYEPTTDFSEERLFDSMLAAAEAIHPDLAAGARRLQAAFDAEDLQNLLVDYTKLFIGPGRPLAMPYGSFWLSGDATLMQDSTLAVADLYRQGGFDVSDDFADLPDHVAVELEFLYVLLFTLQRTRSDGLADEAKTIGALKQRFLREHLGAWVGAFAAATNSNAQTAFYRELAALTERFVQSENL